MEDITISKALLILGLKNNYTEEELKKKYRELAKLYHPDRHGKATEQELQECTRKIQDVNNAYEILKKHLNSRTTYTYENSSSYWTNQSYQGYGYYSQNYDKLISERKKIKKTISKYFKQCPAEKLMNQVSNLILDYVIKVDNSLDPNLTFVNFKIDLEILYKNYINIYCQKQNIPSFLIKEQNFNYNSDCNNLFKQLKDSERIIVIDISKIIKKYKYHEYFKILENKILEERGKIRLKIDYNTSVEEYSNILETYDNIVNKLLVDYTIRYREFKFALDKLSPQLESKIKRYLYNNIKELVLKMNDDELTELLISAIKDSKQSKEAKKTDSKQESEIKTEKASFSNKIKARDIIYNELKRKYLRSSNSIDIEKVNMLFIKATELLYSEKCTMKIVGEINNITFKNPQEEYDKLIKLSTNEMKETEEFLCIKRSEYETESQICKVKKVTNGGINHYIIKYISFVDEFIDEITFKNNYITLEEFFKDAIFLGKKEETYPYDEILYYNSKYDMRLMKLMQMNNPTEYTFVIGNASPSKYSYKKNTIADIYQDKEYLKEDMENCFDREYDYWEKIKKSSSYKH